MLPILYSFRRCPYAIRARMALAYSGIEVELREVFLKEKPDAMLKASPKGTVPILVLSNGTVIEESLDIMLWAVQQTDPDGWLRDELETRALSMIDENDTVFKDNLDKYKYWQPHSEFTREHYRGEAENFLQDLEKKLEQQAFLLSPSMTLVDVAIFPFIRQFCFVDKPWFDQAPYPLLQDWLKFMLESSIFSGVMGKQPFWKEST